MPVSKNNKDQKQNIYGAKFKLLRSVSLPLFLAGCLFVSGCANNQNISDNMAQKQLMASAKKSQSSKFTENLEYVLMNDFTKNNSSIPLAKQEEILSGKYLSGRQAMYNKDISSAVKFNLAVLSGELSTMGAGEQMALMRQTFSLSLADGRYDDAVALAFKIDGQGKSDNLINLFLYVTEAKKSISTHDFAQFKKSFERLEKVNENGIYKLFKPFFRAWLIIEEAKEGHQDVVLKIIEESFKAKDFSDFKNYQAALLCDYLGLNEKAETYYSEALRQAGAMTLRTIESYGNFLKRRGKEQSARVMYEGFLAKVPENTTLLHALKLLDEGEKSGKIISNVKDGFAEIFYAASVYLMRDQIKTVAGIYLRQALFIRQDFPEGSNLLAHVLELDDYHAGALKSYANVGEASHLRYSAKLQSAWIYNKMGKAKKAADLMVALIEEFPEHKEIYAAIGDIHRVNENFTQAAKYYSLFLAGIEVPEEYHWSHFFTRGISYERMGRWPDAEKDFLKALGLKKDEPQVLNYLAYSWVDKGMHYDKAIKMLEKAVLLRPNDGYIIDSLGWALFKMGKIEDSLPILEKAVQIQSDDWAINDHLGDVYWLVGRKNEARFQWRHALSLKPDQDKIRVIKDKIENGFKRDK
jgi:tetratricopeptide (TPR) repeat protein